MPANKTQATLTAPITQTMLADTVKQKLIDLGYSVLDDYTSGTDRFVVANIQLDATKTLGTIFIRFKFTSALATTQTLGTAYNSTTKVLSNAGTESFAATLSSNTNVDVLTYANGNSYKLIFLGQGTFTTSTLLLGFIRPDSQPDWWNENQWPFAFLSRNSDPHFGTLYGSSLVPFTGAGEVGAVAIARMANANPITNKRDLLNKIPLGISGNNGIAGFLPEDFYSISGSGTSKLDTLTLSTGERFDVLLPTGSSASGSAVRTI